jgi:hypothetical protein
MLSAADRWLAVTGMVAVAQSVEPSVVVRVVVGSSPISHPWCVNR